MIKNKFKFSTFLLLISLLGALALGYLFVKNIFFDNQVEDKLASLKEGFIRGEESAALEGSKFSSENYQSPQMGTGSVFLNYASDENQKDLGISDVRNQIFTAKNKNYKILVLSWKTAKPAKCALKYARAGSSDEKSYAEDDFEMEHAVMLESLDSASTYNYVIGAKDRWGNEKESEKFAIYTGAPELSLLDLLGGAFRDIFGWAMR